MTKNQARSLTLSALNPKDDKSDAAEGHEVSRWLQGWKDGDADARERFVAAVYQELRKLARYCLKDERTNHTLQTDALINEAFQRLVGPGEWRAENRKQFLALAAEVMRHVLVDWARRRNYQKRAGATRRVAFEEALTVCAERGDEVVALDDALRSLEQFDPRLARLVELKYFGGCSNAELAEQLGVSVATVKREWLTAKTWLYGQVNKVDD